MSFEKVKELNRVVSLPAETYHELVNLTGKIMVEKKEYVSLSKTQQFKRYGMIQ